MLCATAEAQQRRAAPRQTAPKQAAPRPAGASQQSFERLAAQAAQARDAGRFEEAIGHYRQALAIQPKWDEGWWFLGTLHYERDEFAEAARAFEMATKLQPKIGSAWVLLGLCEYRLGQYDQAAEHLVKGRQLGYPENEELDRVLRYHEAKLATYKGDYEAAQKRLEDIVYGGAKSEELIVALGLATLRITELPENVDTNYRDYKLIRQAGFAAFQHALKNVQDAQREYERLVADYPKTPNVYYAYGRFLVDTRNPEAALEAFKKELENTPTHALARLQIAYQLLTQQKPAEAVPLAQEAVQLNPRMVLGHYIFGRILLEAGETQRAVEELEVARKLSPEEPKIHFALARAYTRANRREEAAKAREEFARLNKLAEEAAARGTPAGEAITETDPNAAGADSTP
jgi:tetratricopeptide (TPR) repeat protein